MQIASIGTQITEAFAGLDRIHELMEMRTEDDEDAARAPLGEIDGRGRVRATSPSSTTRASKCSST